MQKNRDEISSLGGGASSTATDQNRDSLLLNIAGLRAMLDILPEDTERFSTETIDSYLWVIEGLLQNIYQQLCVHMEEG